MPRDEENVLTPEKDGKNKVLRNFNGRQQQPATSSQMKRDEDEDYFYPSPTQWCFIEVVFVGAVLAGKAELGKSLKLLHRVHTSKRDSGECSKFPPSRG